MAKYEKYSLAIGQEDWVRMEAMNKICNPETLNFLKQKLWSGKTVADVGCGPGIMAVEWAKLVGESGKVYAIDISQEQLDLAKKYAQHYNINNIEYICCPVHDLNSLSLQIDVVYSRFLLEHVHEQEAALKNMIDLLVNSGYLFCEALICFESLFSDPHSKAFARWREATLLQPKLSDTDYYIGQKLFDLFKKNGVTPESYEIKQPIMFDKTIRKNFLIGLHGEEIQNKYVEKGFYSKKEIQIIAQDATTFSQTDCLWAFPQYVQIMGRKYEKNCS